MDLSERKKRILKAVVSENIRTAEPVSSLELQKEYLQNVSSATIRNELAALEEMGFLIQPHTSSGRIPTVEGYKKYISELMTEQKLSRLESEKIRETINNRISNITEMVENTAKVIADASNYASIVSMGITDQAAVESFRLIKIDKTRALVLVVTDIGTMKEVVLAPDIDESEILSAEKYMSSRLVGMTLGDIQSVKNSMPKELERYRILFESIIEVITEKSSEDKSKMVVAGKEKLLDYPEYQDIKTFKNTLEVLNDKDKLSSIISSGDELEISVKINPEEKAGSGFSVVTAKYKINGKVAGTASVVGPVRMDYAKAISILKNVTGRIEENMNKE